MTIDTVSALLRRGSRAAAVLGGLALGLLAVPAYAAAPETWEDPDNGSTIELLLVLVGIPLGVIALIALAVYLPSMIKGQSSGSALAFQERAEWFGGPRKGVDAAAEPEPQSAEGKGGASAGW